MILVTGATGNFGAQALDYLLAGGAAGKIAALARDPEKAKALRAQGVEVREGDYADYDSLVKAFAGVERLLFVSGNEVGKRVAQHRNVIEAAKAAGVGRVLYTSILNPPADPYFSATREHVETEKLLRESGLAYTIFRNAFYFETIPMFLGDIRQTKKIVFPAGDARVSHASRRDMAEAAVKALTADGHEYKTYEIGANGSFSFAELAATLSEAIGEPVAYVDVPLEDFRAALVDNQTPAPLVEMIVQVAQAVAHGELEHPSADLENLLGRRLTSLRDYLAETYAADPERGGAAA